MSPETKMSQQTNLSFASNSKFSKLICYWEFFSSTKVQTILWLFPERKSFKASSLLVFSSASVSPSPWIGASKSRSSSSKYSGYFSAYSTLSCSNVFPMKFPSLSACSFSSVRHVLKLVVKKNKYRSAIQIIAFTDCELVYSLFKNNAAWFIMAVTFNCSDFMCWQCLPGKTISASHC